jgi:hypothetical protein
MNPPNAPQRVVLVVAAVAVLALAFYPPLFPRHISRGRFDIELAAVTLATIGLFLALRDLPKLFFRWRLPIVSLAPAGWKRLWIVLSLIYLSAVIGFAWHLYPAVPSEEARVAALKDARTAVLESIFGTARPTGHDAPEPMGTTDYSALFPDGTSLEFPDGTDPAVIQRAVLQVMSHARTTVRTIYDARLRLYYAREQREFVIKAALWWVCPVVGIYLLAISLGWISRGFRSAHEKK